MANTILQVDSQEDWNVITSIKTSTSVNSLESRSPCFQDGLCVSYIERKYTVVEIWGFGINISYTDEQMIVFF